MPVFSLERLAVDSRSRGAASELRQLLVEPLDLDLESMDGVVRVGNALGDVALLIRASTRATLRNDPIALDFAAMASSTCAKRRRGNGRLRFHDKRKLPVSSKFEREDRPASEASEPQRFDAGRLWQGTRERASLLCDHRASASTRFLH